MEVSDYSIYSYGIKTIVVMYLPALTVVISVDGMQFSHKKLGDTELSFRMFCDTNDE